MKQTTSLKHPLFFALPLLMVMLIGGVLPAVYAQAPDTDGDGISDDVDNCVDVANPGQEDTDGDGIGDACDAFPFDPLNDVDGDGIGGDVDNCPNVANPGQEDTDGDGIGDACEADTDADGVIDDIDNCVDIANPGQEDTDGDGIGDACDPIANNAVDVKPGSDTNPVNCKSKGVVPFAIMMDQAGLEAIDLSSLTLNGQSVTEKHNKVHLEDIDGDGVVDYGVVHIPTQQVCEATGDEIGSVEVTLAGNNFEGTDTILIKKK